MEELSLSLEPTTANGFVRRTDDELPELDWEEIRRHDKAGDFWIASCGGVYDVSE